MNVPMSAKQVNGTNGRADMFRLFPQERHTADTLLYSFATVLQSPEGTQRKGQLTEGTVREGQS